MTGCGNATSFDGGVPRAYETHLVPLLFEPYAEDLAERVRALGPASVLEVAAGTGAATRAMASALPKSVSIVATDLNQPMLDQAAELGAARPVLWKQADALQLPFADRSFDAVVCQFGVMFFPDRPRGFAEARRVLRPGGTYLFSAWDALPANELAEIVQESLGALFPNDPPRFMERLPHGYHDPARIEADLAAGGFAVPPRIDRVTRRSRARSARDAAVAYCYGTPLRHEIESRAPGRLDDAVAVAETAIARRFGRGAVDAKMQAFVVAVEA
ncbi:MAG TPA: class I SAM-dependent methyltransferase [Thermoanaerobaculia bacterium]|nr:class I SAM-dependent methyltransferase [Thermoanaerobaculia bacterium]